MRKHLKTLATAMLCLAMALCVSCKKDNVEPSGGGTGGDTPTPTNMINGHEYVDLGLPSGVLWATCNIGAEKPEEYGDYFAWGEVTTKSYYDSNTYQWYDSCHNITKYNRNSEYGTVDNMEVLVLEDDAAHVNWGGDWRMPTCGELDELNNYCTWTWITQYQGDRGGYKVTGSNGNSIFLPAAGSYDGSELHGAGFGGNYLSNSLAIYAPSHFAELLYFHSDKVKVCDNHRWEGCSVRPVCSSQN